MNGPMEALKTQTLPMKVSMEAFLVKKKLGAGTRQNTKKKRKKRSESGTALYEKKTIVVPAAQILTMKPVKVLLTLMEKPVPEHQNQATLQRRTSRSLKSLKLLDRDFSPGL